LKDYHELNTADMEYLFQLDVLPTSASDEILSKKTGPSTTSMFFTLPTSSDSHLDQASMKHLVEAKEKWLAAFNRSYGYTLRSLAFPSLDTPRDRSSPSIVSLLASALPLPKVPSPVSLSTHQEGRCSLASDHTEYSKGWWSNRFIDVLQEAETRQEPPVMLIGDTAMALGRGLKRFHTISRTKRNGPQKLLLPSTTISNSPSGSSNPNQSRRSFLGLKKR
jgi:hypothetical protein